MMPTRSSEADSGRVEVSIRADRATALLDLLHDAVLFVRYSDRRILDANPAFMRLFGYEKDELLGQPTLTIHVDQAHHERFGAIATPHLRKSELSVFVHSFRDNEEARTFLGRGMPDVSKHEAEGDLSAALYVEAFERGGKIDYDHVGGVVTMLSTTSESTGRRAPRIFVDASKNYFDAGRIDEWFAFERWLGPRLQAKVGLVCAYRAQDLQDPKILAQVLETHQYRFGLVKGD